MPRDETLPGSPEHTAPPQYPIESVDNALRLLWLVGERQSLRLTDAGQYLDVAPSTVHRLLAMLQYRGFVQQNAATRAYEAGPTLDRIAVSLLRRMDVRERARPVLEQLSAEGAAAGILHQQRRERGRRVVRRHRAGSTGQSAARGQCFGADQPHERGGPAPHH